MIGDPRSSRKEVVFKEFIRLRRRPRLRAETVACMGPFGEDRHFGVQARGLPVDECVNCATIIHELKYCCFGGFR